VPEYLAPGVYVEETSFRSKSIEGVGTSTTAFVGPTQRGPLLDATKGDLPELLTSFADFERQFGGLHDLSLGNKLDTNWLAHSVKAYFDNGGGRLYVVRAFGGTVSSASAKSGDAFTDGAAQAAKKAVFAARQPGAAFTGMKVVVAFGSAPIGKSGIQFAPKGTVLHSKEVSGQTTTRFLWTAGGDGTWAKANAADGVAVAVVNNVPHVPTTAEQLFASVALTQIDPTSGEEVTVARWDDLGLAPGHPRALFDVLAMKPAKRSDDQGNPIGIQLDADFAANTVKTVAGLAGGDNKVVTMLEGLDAGKPVAPVSFALTGGGDGDALLSADYEKALKVVAALEDVSIVAAPGCWKAAKDTTNAESTVGALITHAEGARMYRIAVLDAPFEQTPSQMRTVRGKVDSKYAAMYYPGVVVANPLAGPKSAAKSELLLPPSGFVCGVYARNDVQRGVFKAPANEVVRGALRFERDVNFGDQQLLNPLGVNCLRYLSGRGYRVWGARTVSSDPEWKYVNVRRYFNYLGASIDRGTQWAVFEPNGELLWANIRGTIGDFLFAEWKTGALLGTKPEEAFFVRCDRTTMSQNDLDNGRLICLIGVAVVKPAEFVIFRIGQKTADAKS
jgi:uncharacterized protein